MFSSTTIASIDDDPDRQDETEQRQAVQREPHQRT